MKDILSGLFGRAPEAGAAREVEDPELKRLLSHAAAHQAQGKTGEADECLRNWARLRVRQGNRKPSTRSTRVSVPATTLVCIDCRDYDLAADALRRCLERCSFERALFLTDGDVQVEGVETVRIEKIASIEAYSRFVLKDLDRYIHTDFALLVQYDGYIINPDCWSREFQEYDYVGARWPLSDGMAVGNGGFSLRSKRLLRALQDPQIVLRSEPEDVAICRVYRRLLESKHAIRFAPEALADRFSFETVEPEGQTFGFHGTDHMVNLFDLSDFELSGYRPAPLKAPGTPGRA